MFHHVGLCQLHTQLLCTQLTKAYVAETSCAVAHDIPISTSFLSTASSCYAPIFPHHVFQTNDAATVGTPSLNP